MFATESPTQQEFTRKSETESICMHCFLTVRTDRWTRLEVAEDIHADVCLMKVESALWYAIF
jgi:hypothetical protein